MESLGFIETVGLVTALECADSALKTANVELVRKDNPGAGLICVVVKGEIGAVRAAVEAAQEAGNRVGKVVATNVIAKPDAQLASL